MKPVEQSEIPSDKNKGEKSKDSEDMTKNKVPEEKKVIYVYVCGAVRHPGVYEMDQGDRVTHAILKAGGITDEAAEDYLNQAAVLEDGQKIDVPTVEEAKLLQQSEVSGGEGDSGMNKSSKININTASKEELMTLKGIGESRADDIIAFRKSNGPFKSIEDIKKIDGIKEKLFREIEDQITVK